MSSIEEKWLDPLNLLKEQSTDARLWAMSFCHKTGYEDFQNAVGWFANAIVTAQDKFIKETEKRVAREVIEMLEKFGCKGHIDLGISALSYDTAILDTSIIINELKQKYGVSDE